MSFFRDDADREAYRDAHRRVLSTVDDHEPPRECRALFKKIYGVMPQAQHHVALGLELERFGYSRPAHLARRVCPQCGHGWNPRKANPRSCPRCVRPLEAPAPLPRMAERSCPACDHVWSPRADAKHPSRCPNCARRRLRWRCERCDHRWETVTSSTAPPSRCPVPSCTTVVPDTDPS